MWARRFEDGRHGFVLAAGSTKGPVLDSVMREGGQVAGGMPSSARRWWFIFHLLCGSLASLDATLTDMD